VVSIAAMTRSKRSLRQRALNLACGLIAIVNATYAIAACPFTDGAWDLTNSALVFSRYALTVSGPPLVASTRFASADPALVKRDLDNLRGPLDMNGDGQITSVDSTIVARHVAGIRDSALTAGLSLGAASRNTTDKVLAFINAGCPAAIGARTPIYEALTYVTDRATLLAQMNAQGARGFQYISGLLVGSEFVNLYVKDQNTNFSYSAQDAASTASDWLAQLNSMGASGFRFDGPLTSGNYYVRDNTASLTYSYELPVAPTTTTGFLAQANGRGASGFFFVLTYSIGGSTVAIYGKDTSEARYQYELHPSTDVNVSADDFVVQANTQGARGFKFVTGFFFSDGARNIYVKDTAQAATFSYKATATVNSGAALVAQANAEGQQNFVYMGGLIFFPNGYSGAQQARNIYVNPANCAGWVMCSAGGPF
jgi:hypothetical protein